MLKLQCCYKDYVTGLCKRNLFKDYTVKLLLIYFFTNVAKKSLKTNIAKLNWNNMAPKSNFIEDTFCSV